MAVPYTFGNATVALPLSQLDTNFATPITVGGAPVRLGDTVSAISGVNVSASTVLATGANTARTLASYASDIINVKDFGAVGDGVVDDTSAIQAAITYAQNSNGRVVFFPNGSYKTTSELLVSNSGVYLKGEGIGVSKIIANFGNDNIIRFYKAAALSPSGWGGNGFFYGGVSDLSLKSTAVTLTAGAGITIDNVSEIYISNVFIETTYIGISIVDTGVVRISNVDAANVGLDAYRVNWTPNVLFNSCSGFQASNPVQACFHIISCGGIHITDCISSSYNYALLIDPPAGKFVCDLFVNGCDFDNSQFCGISIDESNGGDIYALQFDSSRVGFGAGSGLVINGGDNINFSNFQSVKNTEYGILILSGSHIIFNDCQVLGNSSIGGAYDNVFVSGGDSISFIGGVVGKWRSELTNTPYGFAIDSTFSGYFRATTVDLRNNATGPVSNTSVTGNVKFSDCPGYINSASGQITITTGNTVAAASHGMTITPYSVTIGGEYASKSYAVTFNATTITAAASSAVAGDTKIWWQAKSVDCP